MEMGADALTSLGAAASLAAAVAGAGGNALTSLCAGDLLAAAAAMTPACDRVGDTLPPSARHRAPVDLPQWVTAEERALSRSISGPSPEERRHVTKDGTIYGLEVPDEYGNYRLVTLGSGKAAYFNKGSGVDRFWLSPAAPAVSEGVAEFLDIVVSTCRSPLHHTSISRDDYERYFDCGCRSPRRTAPSRTRWRRTASRTTRS